MDQTNDKIMCPSSRAKAGAQLLGVRQEDGTVAILPQTLPVTDSFVEIAAQSGKAEERFRFTNKCVENGCMQWTGSRCGVADRVLQFLEQVPEMAELPRCAIRPNCRWHVQAGDQACRMCTYVITEITEEEVEAYEAKVYERQIFSA